jgi:membrane protease YdiL (CAAX protease family)
VAALFAGLNFLAAGAGETDRNVLYKYSFVGSSLVGSAILVGVTLLIARWMGRPVAAIGLKGFEWRWLGAAAGVILAVAVLGVLLEPVLHAGEEQGFEPTAWDPDRVGAFALNAVLVATLAPFAEELFFRGLGVRALLPFGGLAAIGVSALAFGLGHGLLVALPVLVVFGAGLGWVRLRSGSVWPGMLAHGFYNGAILLYVYLDLTSRV